MSIEPLKHHYLKLKKTIQTQYWPSTVHYLESNSPLKLFTRAILLGLLLSIPWQCSRLIFNDFSAQSPEKINEINSTLSLPNFDDGSVTNMPNPKARRPSPVPIDVAPEVAEQASQIEVLESTSVNTQTEQEAKILAQTAPEYPASALRKQESGTVLVRVVIDAKGKVKDTSVEQSSNYRTLDRAARKAVSKWKFSPKIQNGIPVQSELLIPIEYKSE